MGESDHERKVFESQVKKHVEHYKGTKTEGQIRKEVQGIAQQVERNREAQKKPRLK